MRFNLNIKKFIPNYLQVIIVIFHKKIISFKLQSSVPIKLGLESRDNVHNIRKTQKRARFLLSFGPFEETINTQETQSRTTTTTSPSLSRFTFLKSSPLCKLFLSFTLLFSPFVLVLDLFCSKFRLWREPDFGIVLMFFFSQFFWLWKMGFSCFCCGAVKKTKKKYFHCFYDEYWQMGSLKKGF